MKDDAQNLTVRDRWLAIAFAAGLLLLLAWKILELGHARWYQDEGEYVSVAWLILEGDQLYRDIFLPSPPLFIYSLAASMFVLGKSLYAARIAIAVYSVMGIAATGLIAREFGGWTAAFASVAFLTVYPLYFSLSRIAMSDVPGAALLMVSILFMLQYWTSYRRKWLVASGLVKGLGLLVKLVSIPMLGFFVVIILVGHLMGNRRPFTWRRVRDAIADGLLWGTALLAPLVMATRYYGGALWQQAVLFQWNAREHYELDIGRRLDKFGQAAMVDTAVFGLVLFGIYVLARRRDWKAIIPLGGLIFAALGVFFHVPLSMHHLVPVTPFLAILGGLAVDAIVSSLISVVGRRKSALPVPAFAVGVAIFLLSLSYAPLIYQTNRTARLGTLYNNRQAEDTMSVIRSVTPLADVVITDDPLLVLMAERRVLPELGSISSRRLKAGQLSGVRLIDLAENYHRPPVIFRKNLFKRVPEFVEWLNVNYRPLVMDDDVTIFFPEQFRFPTSREAAKGLNLIFTKLDNVSPLRRERLPLVLIFECGPKPPDRDYLFSIKLKDEGQSVVDEQAYRTEFPVNRCFPGELLYERQDVNISTDITPGHYQVVLQAVQQDGLDDRTGSDGPEIVLGEVVIPPDVHLAPSFAQ